MLRASVSVEDAARLDAWQAELQSARANTDAAAAKQIAELRRRLTKEFGEADVTLTTRRRWPILASLNWIDLLFMSGSLLVLNLPFWLRVLAKFVPVSQANRLAWMIVTGLPLAISTVWWLNVPERQDPSPYKAGRLAATAEAKSAPVVFDSVVWPPIPFGLSESVVEKKYVPPSWWWKKSKTEPGSMSNKPVAAPTPWDTPHWLGTDALGRDVLSRMIWGGRVSLSVGIVSVVIYVGLGILIGALAGYFRGYVDLAISRFIEIVICFPTFFLILTIVALRGPSIWNIMVVIGLTGWTGVARLIRAEFLRLVDQEFVLAGRALGYSSTRLIFRHILPNAMAPVLVSATFGIAGAILTESALSYLGLGITIPIPSWGSLLLDGRNSENVAPWLVFLPGLLIFLTITCYNLVGEALRDASDPRLRGSR